ncbi:MAG TPA: ABC transporter permease subunit, partial [Candidatus Limnocylindrales bacterium]|nr:ABC transporter permease subunit [Candidatus Limnocylindrales bacterium]
MVVFALAADAVYTLATAPNLNWNQVWTWLFRPFILGGIVVTIELTVLAMVIGIVLGVVLAVMRLSPNPVMSWVSWLYIWFFRGTPVLVQIFFWYNLNAVLPHVGLIIPGTDLGWQTGTNSLISAFIAA